MITVSQIQQHPSAVEMYIRHGWSLVPIPPNTKGPRSIGWNLAENALRSQADLPTGYGIGLAHAYSGTMALDIDDWETAVMYLKRYNIDLPTLYTEPDAVVINSGRPGHGKLLYAMPEGVAPPSKKIIVNGTVVLELRCATTNGLTVQDVLPPSIHPATGQPYQWGNSGNWAQLPTIPTELIDLWQSLLHVDRHRSIESSDTLNASWQEIQSALEHVSPDVSRDDWIAIGMALNWAGNQTNQLDHALDLWDDWSAQSQTKYPGEKEILSQWGSFRADKVKSIKLGTLFHIAKQNGWVRPVPDAVDLFSTIEPVVPPAQLLKSLRPSPPDIDLSLFPNVLALRATDLSVSIGCDPLVPLWSGLAAVCGVADARIRLELMNGYEVPPVLWLMTIGAPADKKSPGSKPMLVPLKIIENEDRQRFAKAFLDWEGEEAAYSAAKRAFLEFAASSEGMLGHEPPSVPELSPQPVPLRLTVSDITSQKLIRYAADRPEGLLCYLDEMNGWVRKMVDRGSGEDRSSWVVAYESDHYDMDRVGSGAIHCDNLAVSIYGNIQPAIFRQNLPALSADGLLQRFVPAILRPNYTKLGNPLPAYLSNHHEWEQTLRKVFAVAPGRYVLSKPAYSLFREFQQWYERTKEDERLLQSSDEFMTAFGKLEGTTGRLILIFHLIESPYEQLVSDDVVKRVITLVKSYVVPAMRYALIEVGGVDSFDSWLTDYVIHQADKSSISLMDIKRSARRQLERHNAHQQTQQILSSMVLMEQCKWVHRLDDGTREHQHIAHWAINPQLITMFQDYKSNVKDARKRRHYGSRDDN